MASSRARLGVVGVVVAMMAVAFVVFVPPSRAATNGYVLSDAYIPVPGGPVLHAWIYRPADVPADEATPVLLVASPYPGSSARLVGELVGFSVPPSMEIAPPSQLVSAGVFQRGYTIVEVSLRGFGASTGCADLGGPGEQADARAAVEWAASQPWSTGRVGMYGGSYAGWAQLMAAMDPAPAGLVAVAPSAALSGLYDALYSNGVAHANFRSGFAATYVAIDVPPPLGLEGLSTVTNPVADYLANPLCGLEGIVPTITRHDRGAPYYQERELAPRLQGSAIPVFATHGFVDFRVRPNHLMEWWPTLTGPRHLWIGQFGHSNPPRGSRLEELMDFYDRYVKEVPVDGVPAPVTVEEGHGRWREEAAWPPADATYLDLPVRAGHYLDVPGNFAEPNEATAAPDPLRVDASLLPTGIGSWTFTEPFPHAAHLAGVVRAEIDARGLLPGANLIALLYDVDPANRATLITRGAQLLSGPGRYRFDLQPQDWRLEPGHRLGLLLTASDLTWFETSSSGLVVDVAGGRLEVPFLQVERLAVRDDLAPSAVVSQRAPVVVPAAVVQERTTAGGFPPPLAPGD